jgi:hypothetical protein
MKKGKEKAIESYIIFTFSIFSSHLFELELGLGVLPCQNKYMNRGNLYSDQASQIKLAFGNVKCDSS